MNRPGWRQELKPPDCMGKPDGYFWEHSLFLYGADSLDGLYDAKQYLSV